ncbi:MAG: acyltransferase [Acidimicrobiales bacterium]
MFFGGLAHSAVWWIWGLVVRVGTIKSGRPSARRFGHFGANTAICFPVASLIGEDRMSIGSDTVVGPYSTVSAGLPGQPPNPWWAGPTLVIGDRCVIGRNATITAHREVRIGDDVWTGNGIFITDQNHGWDDPAAPIGDQSQEPRPVEVGDGAWLGHGVAVLPGVRIGPGAVIGAGPSSAATCRPGQWRMAFQRESFACAMWTRPPSPRPPPSLPQPDPPGPLLGL